MSDAAQLWLATVAAVISLLAAAVPASIQLFEDPPAPAPQPVAAPVAAPAPPAPVDEPATAARGGERERNDRRGRGG